MFLQNSHHEGDLITVNINYFSSIKLWDDKLLHRTLIQTTLTSSNFKRDTPNQSLLGM